MVNRELALHFALRSDNVVEVGILGGDIVVRRGGWLVRMLRESCTRWLQEVMLVRERRLPMALVTVHYTGGVLRIYRLGQPWLVLEGVSDHYVAIDFAAKVRRFKPCGSSMRRSWGPDSVSTSTRTSKHVVPRPRQRTRVSGMRSS